MLANAHDDAPEGNLRTCIAGGGEHPPAGLIRLALSPDGIVTPDFGTRLGGRGAWISADPEAINRAVSKGLFARAFKRPATAPGDLAGECIAWPGPDEFSTVTASTRPPAHPKAGLPGLAGPPSPRCRAEFERSRRRSRIGRPKSLNGVLNPSRGPPEWLYPPDWAGVSDADHGAGSPLTPTACSI